MDHDLLTVMTVSLPRGSHWVMGLLCSFHCKLHTMLVGLVTLATGTSCFIFSPLFQAEPIGPNYCRWPLFSNSNIRAVMLESVPRMGHILTIFASKVIPVKLRVHLLWKNMSLLSTAMKTMK